MEWVETTGKTVSEAKDAALDQLGVDDVDAEFEVVSDAKTGLFGRLKEEARVRARVRPSATRSKETNSRRRGARPKHERSTSGPTSTRSRVASEPAADGTDASPEGDEETSPSTPSSDKPSTRRGRRSRSEGRKPKAQATGEGAMQMPEEDVSLDQQGEVAEEFLQGFFRETNLPVTVERATIDDELVSLAVEGANLGHLIGPRGSTLHSLQELTRTVVQRKTGSRSARVIVDILGYRVKRRAALEEFTQQVAATVISTGTSQALEPMNPADRKVVHDAANAIEGVVTSSEGEEPRRWVILRLES